MTTPTPKTFVVRGWHVLVAVVAFFTVVVGIDSLFVVWAVQTFPGEVSPKAYESGLAYNRTLAARRVEARLGWTVRVTQGARPGAVTAEITGAEGEKLEGLAVKAIFMRPATQRHATVTALRAADGGRYLGDARLADGAWDLTLTATDRQGRHLEAHRRLIWR